MTTYKPILHTCDIRSLFSDKNINTSTNILHHLKKAIYFNTMLST